MVFIQFWKTVFIYHDFIHISFSYIIINFNCKYEKKNSEQFWLHSVHYFSVDDCDCRSSHCSPPAATYYILKVPGSFLCDLSGMIVCTLVTEVIFDLVVSRGVARTKIFWGLQYCMVFVWGVAHRSYNVFFCAQVICRWHIIVIVIVDK